MSLHSRRRSRGQRGMIAGAVAAAIVLAGTVAIMSASSGSALRRAHHVVRSLAPTGPPAGTRLCAGGSDASVLAGPSTAPGGAVTVPSGDDSAYFEQPYVYSLPANTTYWFASGMHTIGNTQYNQIVPSSGDTFIGAPGAVLDGQGTNASAFDGSATDVTIEYLTIEDFASSGSGQMVVNHDGAAGWTVRYDTVQDNLGAGVGIGSDNVITHNCLAANDEYGFSSFGGSRDVTLTGNDISDNDTHGTYDQAAYTTSYSVTDDVATVTIRAPMDLLVGSRIVVGDVGACTDSWCANLSYTALDGTWTIASVTSATSFTFDVVTANVPYTKDTTGTVADPQVTCGCSGGGKFWNTLGATVTGNWVHDNGNVGIWVDTDNTGFDISGNYFDHNWAEAVIYEISYNASIANNAFVDNVLGGGPSPGVGGFPDAAALHLRVGQRQPGGRPLRGHLRRDRQRLHRQLGRGRHLRELQSCMWHHQRHLLHVGCPCDVHTFHLRGQHSQRQYGRHAGLRGQLPVEVTARRRHAQYVQLHAAPDRARLYDRQHLWIQRVVQRRRNDSVGHLRRDMA